MLSDIGTGTVLGAEDIAGRRLKVRGSSQRAFTGQEGGEGLPMSE